MTPVHPAPGGTGDPAEPVRPGDHAEAAAEAVRALTRTVLVSLGGGTAGASALSPADPIVPAPDGSTFVIEVIR